jgi:hypothetical protein
MAENPMLSFLWTGGEESHDANLPTPSTPADLILADDLDADPIFFLCGNVRQV